MQYKPERSLLDENGQLVSAQTDTYLDTTHVRFKQPNRRRIGCWVMLCVFALINCMVFLAVSWLSDDEGEYYFVTTATPTLPPFINRQSHTVNTPLLPNLKATETISRTIRPEASEEAIFSIVDREQWIAGDLSWLDEHDSEIPLCHESSVNSSNKIAYLSIVDNNANPPLATLYIADWESSATCRLTPYNVMDYTKIAWSPDGEKIATTIYPFDTRGMGIYLLDQQNPTPRLISHQCRHARDPDWSPDGTRLVFEGDCGDAMRETKMYVLDLITRNLQPLTTGSSPVWSNDGKKIAYYVWATQAADIYLYDLEIGTSEQLVYTGGIREGLTWAPDGQQLAYTGYDGDIYTIDVTTREIRRLTDESGDDRHPLWLPNNRIAFLSSWQAPEHAETTALFTMSPYGIFIRRWSPYTQIIAFDWYTSG